MQRDYDANNSNLVQLGYSRHADAAASGCQIQRQWERTFDPDTPLTGGRTEFPDERQHVLWSSHGHW